MLARGQPFACVSRHGDLVTSLTLSFADDHLENERILLGSPANLDHVDLLGMHVPALAGGCSVRCDPQRRDSYPRRSRYLGVTDLNPVGRASAAGAVSTRPPCKTLALAGG